MSCTEDGDARTIIKSTAARCVALLLHCNKILSFPREFCNAVAQHEKTRYHARVELRFRFFFTTTEHIGTKIMITKPEQLSDLQKKNLEAAMRLAQLSIENSQRIMELQVATAKSLFEDGVNNAKAISTAKDPQQMMELRTRFAQTSAEKMLQCAREITELASQAQTEVGKLVGAQLSSGGQDVLEVFQKMFQGMPVSDQNMMNAVQSAIDTTRSAFEQMARVSSDAFQMFNQTMSNAAAGKKK